MKLDPAEKSFATGCGLLVLFSAMIDARLSFQMAGIALATLYVYHHMDVSRR